MPRSPNPRSTGSLEARRAAYARQQATRPPGGRPTPLPSLHQPPSRLRGWAIVLAWLLTLVALLLAGAAWFLMAAALVTPISLSRAALQIVLLTPALGAALALPAVCCALLATRRAKRLGARLAAPVTLVWLATAILVAGLLFGGLVAAPRYRLGQFALGIQAHCARVAASLQAYGTPPDATTLLANIQAVSQTLLADEAALPGDVQALAALSAPQPQYAPLLQDCQTVAQDDKQFIGDLKTSMMQAVAARPPNPAPVVNTLTTYNKQVGAALAEIETLGAALKQEVYAPFQPG